MRLIVPRRDEKAANAARLAHMDLLVASANAARRAGAVMVAWAFERSIPALEEAMGAHSVVADLADQREDI